MAAKLGAPRLQANSLSHTKVEQRHNEPASTTSLSVDAKAPSPPTPPSSYSPQLPTPSVQTTSVIQNSTNKSIPAPSVQQSVTSHPSGFIGAPSSLLKLATSSRKSLINASQSASTEMAMRLQEAVLSQQQHQQQQHGQEQLIQHQQQDEKENRTALSTVNDKEQNALQLWAAANDAAKRAEMAIAETSDLITQTLPVYPSKINVANPTTPYQQDVSTMRPLISMAPVSSANKPPILLHPSATEIAVPASNAAKALATGFPVVLLGYSARALFIEHNANSSSSLSTSPRFRGSPTVACSPLSPVHPTLMLPLLETMGLLPVLPEVSEDGEVINESLFLRHDDPNAHRPFKSASVLLTRHITCLFRSAPDGRTLRWYPALLDSNNNIIDQALSIHKTGEVPLFSITEAELLKTSSTHLRMKAQIAVPLSIVFSNHNETNTDPDGVLGKIARVLSSGPSTQNVPPTATHALVLISLRLALSSEKERHVFLKGLVFVRSVCPVPDAVADVFMSQHDIAAVSSTNGDEDEIQFSFPTVERRSQHQPSPTPPPPPPTQLIAPLPFSSMQPVSLADHVRWLQLNGGIELQTQDDDEEEDDDDDNEVYGNKDEENEKTSSLTYYSNIKESVQVPYTPSNTQTASNIGTVSAAALSPLISLGRPSLNSFGPSPSPVVRLATINVQPSITPMQQPYVSGVPSASRILRPRNVSASSLLSGSGGGSGGISNPYNNNSNNNNNIAAHQHHQQQMMFRGGSTVLQNAIAGGGSYPHAISGTSSAMASSAAIAASVARINVRGGHTPSIQSTSRSGWNSGEQHYGAGVMLTRPPPPSSSFQIQSKETIPSMQFSTPFRQQQGIGGQYLQGGQYSQQRVFFDDVPSVATGRGPR
jgi:hypothetical protein